MKKMLNLGKILYKKAPQVAGVHISRVCYTCNA